jgi:ribosomal protein S18 acetylase RimI-like enzyme
MEVRLQMAEHSDLPLVLNYVRAYHEFEGIDDPQDVSSSFRPLLGQNPFGRIWLIYNGSRAVGYVAVCFGYSIEFAGRDAFIDEMFIVPEQRAKGIGKAALQLLRNEANALDIRALHLEVARTNERARRLYQSAGFKARDQFFLMSSRISRAITDEVAESGPSTHPRPSD